MGLQRNTVILLAIAVFAGGLTYGIIQRTKVVESKTASQSQAIKLFNFSESQIRGLSIEVSGQNLVFQQQIATINEWWLLEPEKRRANRGAISFLLNLLLNDQGKQESFAVTQAQLADYGLAEPYGKLTMQLVDGTEHRLALGTENFDRTKIYGRMDDELLVWVLPLDFRNGITRELAEWVETDSSTDASIGGE